MPHRLFIAIRPPEFVRDALVDAMEGIEGARWAGEESLHLTLRFVGEVERPAANTPVASGMATLTTGMAASSLAVVVQAVSSAPSAAPASRRLSMAISPLDRAARFARRFHP